MAASNVTGTSPGRGASAPRTPPVASSRSGTQVSRAFFAPAGAAAAGLASRPRAFGAVVASSTSR
ncbi:MAG: hypothetical protein U1E39_15490 [Planctomycetota bacterium]